MEPSTLITPMLMRSNFPYLCITSSIIFLDILRYSCYIKTLPYKIWSCNAWFPQSGLVSCTSCTFRYFFFKECFEMVVAWRMRLSNHHYKQHLRPIIPWLLLFDQCQMKSKNTCTPGISYLYTAVLWLCLLVAWCLVISNQITHEPTIFTFNKH